MEPDARIRVNEKGFCQRHHKMLSEQKNKLGHALMCHTHLKTTMQKAHGAFDRAQIAASTGYAIQVVFDTPFYKLRGGGWTSKKAAEDKARELSAYNINAFVVKVK